MTREKGRAQHYVRLPAPQPTRRCVLISRPGELERSARLPAPLLVADRCSPDARPQLVLVRAEALLGGTAPLPACRPLLPSSAMLVVGLPAVLIAPVLRAEKEDVKDAASLLLKLPWLAVSSSSLLPVSSCCAASGRSAAAAAACACCHTMASWCCRSLALRGRVEEGRWSGGSMMRVCMQTAALDSKLGRVLQRRLQVSRKNTSCCHAHILRGDGVPPRSSACVVARGDVLPCRTEPSVRLAAQSTGGWQMRSGRFQPQSTKQRLLLDTLVCTDRVNSAATATPQCSLHQPAAART